MKLKLPLIFLCFSTILMGKTWIINKDHSEFLFKIKYLGFSEVTGRFKIFNGFAEIEEENNTLQSFELFLNTNSVDTSNPLRDSHLKRSDFFNSKIYPQIHFVSTKFSKKTDQQIWVHGLITIKGITQKIEVRGLFKGPILDSWGYPSYFISFKKNLQRSDFNMTWNKTLKGEDLLLSDNVECSGSIQLQFVGSKTPTSKHLIPDTKYSKTYEIKKTGEVSTERLNSINSTSQLKTNDTDSKYISLLPDSNSKSSKKLRFENHQGKKTILWWLSFLFVGFIGFCAVIMLAFYFKRKFNQSYNSEIHHNNFKSISTDLTIILLALLYSAALYVLLTTN